MKTYKNCIYRLYFEGDEKSYVGSASNFNNRYRQHIKELLDGIHSNRLLQFAFNKFGVLAFKWEILEKDIPNKKLLAKENYYILKYKACTEGYNQAYSTGNAKGNEVFVNEYVNLDDNDVIEKFLEKHEVEIREIHCKGVKYDEIRKVNFSKAWWNKVDTETLHRVVMMIHNQMQNVSEARQYNTLTICDEIDILDKHFNIKHAKKSIRDLVSTIKKYYYNKFNDRTYEHIMLMSALNPFHMDMPKMEEKDIYKYRLIKMFRLLGSFKLEDKIVIHVPRVYYEGYKELVEEYSCCHEEGCKSAKKQKQKFTNP